MAWEKPAWLDACCMQNYLRQSAGIESLEVSGITVEPAVAEGENFCSDLYRVLVELSWVERGHKVAGKRCYVLKVAPHDKFREKQVTERGLFHNEMSIVTDVLPRINEMLAKLNIPRFNPLFLHLQCKNPILLMMEDLKANGYETANRQIGLDLDHSLLVIKHIAIFHACSVALEEQDPKTVAKFRTGKYHDNESLEILQYYKDNIMSLARATKNWPEINPRISEKILKLSESAHEKACDAYRYQQGGFNVLNHGDVWTNNIMFRYDEYHKPVDIMLMDFQLAHQASPAADILHFFATSLSDDVELNDREKLVHEYHVWLTSTMAKLECKTKTPSYDDLRDILQSHAFIEVVLSFTTLANSIKDKSVNVKLADMISKDNVQYDNPAYRATRYAQIMTKRLPMYDSLGLLDS